ncbi:hypothetical protein OJF2_04420 [Aquisphaera giovannonii]|uniref:HicB-like antitoxin of toxin-antitoxin system domain-containing protein n=1 Tax=Aquisphaera giovannonii TaxID=406548 RepID=A0A5B9VW09_9BACT|nr:type II toxin-antitoxin system HicB family antitoxin [Aquisphaera giovannonii]QEH31975.1 hypothetical protein OJF2_04420 [Aquisphaera giovannonii]
MPLPIEVEQGDDGRRLAEIRNLPGVMAYGATPEEAIARVQVLGLRTPADRIAHGEPIPPGLDVLFAVPA